MRTLEAIQEEYNSIRNILDWDTVTAESLLARDFPEGANFVPFTGRMDNRLVRGRLTQDREGNVSVHIDHAMLPCELNSRITELHREAGQIFLEIGV